MVTFLGQIMGAAIGGVLVGLPGVKWSIGVNSASFLISALASACIVYHEQVRTASKGYLSDIREGFRHLRTEKMLARVLSASCSRLLITLCTDDISKTAGKAKHRFIM